jgi:hypothetical protein
MLISDITVLFLTNSLVAIHFKEILFDIGAEFVGKIQRIEKVAV